MATYPSSARYFGIASQSGKGTPASSPSLFIPAVKSQSKFKWNQNIQLERYSTGDLFILVDGVPVKPSAVGTIVFPFKPSVLNGLLAINGIANGDIAKPLWATVFVGDGLNEKIYSDVLCSDSSMTVDDSSGPAMWTANYMGLNAPVLHAVRAITMPAYERSYTIKDLTLMTILSNNSAKNIEKLVWHFMAGITAYFGSKGDGTLGPSDLIMNELGVSIEVTRAYEDDAVRAAYMNACGAPGEFTSQLATTCGSSHSHQLSLPKGLVMDDEEDSPDNLPIDEPFTVQGLRDSSSSGAPGILTIA